MKSVLRPLALICLAVSIITSCKKSINEKVEQRSSVALTTPGNSCRAIGLGLAAKDSPGNTIWENLLLKWFDGQGKIEHLKANIYWFYQTPTSNLRAFALDYGEVTYVNDEVHVRDVLYNEEVFKVKLDAQKRPVISWFDHHGRSQSTYRYDTSYYFYNSDNQLESVIVHRRELIGGFGNFGGDGIINMRFQYDPVGNLVEANFSDPAPSFKFRYDYTKTNAGMVSNYLISVPIKLLEYLDLLKLNHHHQLQDVFSWYYFRFWTYSNIETNLFGQVTRYDGTNNGSPISTYYTAWDCGGNQAIQSKNPTQKEFMHMVH